MNKVSYRLKSWHFLSTGLFLAGAAQAVSLYTIDTDEPEEKKSEVVVAYDYAWIDEEDNAASVAERLGIREPDMGGFEYFYFENDSDADWRFFLEGQYLVHPEEIAFSIEAFKEEVFRINIDFQHWREYDYGAGIYYPPSDVMYLLDPDFLVEDINKLSIALKATPGDTLQWKLSYSLFSRKGTSLSTIYGDNYQFRIGGRPSRGTVPALVEGEESVHTVDLEVKSEDEVDRTGVRVHFQRRDVGRDRSVNRAVEQPTANRYATDTQNSVDDLFGFSAFRRKQLTDSVFGSIGLSYTRLDGDISGSRIFGANPDAMYDIDFAALQKDDRGYLDLDGMRKLKQWILNGNLVFQPEGNFRWMTGIRLEFLESSAFSSYLDTVYQADWSNVAIQRQEAVMSSASDKDAFDLSAFLEMRYTGFSKATVYSRVEAATQSGSLYEDWSRQEIVPDDGELVSLLDRATDFDRLRGFWETGVNYYPTSALRISLEGYLKYREYDYGYGYLTVPTTDWTEYPGFIEHQEFSTRDVNARVHWRILPSLKSVTRIDLQDTSIKSKDRLYPELESADRERVVFNQSLTWTPHPRFFATAAYHLVNDLTKTPAADMEGTFSGIIVNLPNDYWQADLDLYYVISKLIDIQLGYHYLEMSNYVDNSPRTVPYGSDLEQHHATATLIFHFSELMAARIGYHYFEETDLAAANLRDYKIHLVSSSFQVKF